MMQRQEVMDSMIESIDRLKNTSVSITSELKTQQQMLADTREEMDEASSHFQVALRKIDKRLGGSDRGRLWCIAGLVAIVILLLAYT
jgi:hypothetical protein